MKKSILTVIAVMFCISQLSAQDATIPLIGSKAPSFKASSTNGEIKFPGDFGSSWKIMFSHPKDFTPVCSSELLELAYAQDEFSELGVKFIVMSTDILDQHNSWKAALEQIPYKDRDPVEIEFPIVADNDLKVSKLYGMIHSQSSVTENIRGVYIISPDNVVRSIMFYPNEVGRNIEELKRTVIALQTNYNDRTVVTPANWEPGDDVIVPVLSQEDKASLNNPNSNFYQASWFMTFKKE